jgi:hypothetical protein
MDSLKRLKASISRRQDAEQLKSYSIGRNEICPCGSGKKFKKCCGLNNPKQSIEDYFTAIKTANSEEEVIAILKEAVKSYPVEHRFLLPLIVYTLQNNQYQEAVKYLSHAWQLMGTDLDEAFISPLVNILLEKEEAEKAEQIVREALTAKGESIPLLIALAEVYKQKNQLQRLNDTIERAMQIEADNAQLLVFRLETLMDFDDVVSALSLFKKHYDKLKEYKNMRVISFLIDFVNERFNLDVNQKITQQQALAQAAEVFNVFQQLDNLKVKSNAETVEKLLAEIKNLAPANSKLALDILARYLAAELYNGFADYAAELETVQMKNPSYLQLLFLADLQQGKLESAETKIKAAFKLAQQQEADHFHDWQIAADYLRFLLEHGPEKEIAEFITELASLIEDQDNLLANLMMLVENAEGRDYQKHLLRKLISLKEEQLLAKITLKDIYNNLLFISLAALDGEETIYENGNQITTATLAGIIDEVEAAAVETPAVEYAKLRLLKYQAELDPAVKADLLGQIKQAEITSYFDTVAYYEAILRFGDPAPILTEIPHGKYLDDEYLDFYRLVAALKLKYYEIGTELFHRQLLRESKQNKVISFLVRLLRYFTAENLEEHLRKMQVNEVIINYLRNLNTNRD